MEEGGDRLNRHDNVARGLCTALVDVAKETLEAVGLQQRRTELVGRRQRARAGIEGCNHGCALCRRRAIPGGGVGVDGAESFAVALRKVVDARSWRSPRPSDGSGRR